MVISLSASSFNLIQLLDTEIKVNSVIHMDSGDIITANSSYYLFKWGMKGDFKNGLETSSCDNLVLKNCAVKTQNQKEMNLIITGGTRGVIDIFLNQIKIIHFVLN